MNDNSATKGRRMKWDWEKTIHQELVGGIQQIQAEMDVLAQLYPYTLKDIQKLIIKTEKGPE